ncbi:MAG: serine hydrolase, partial [Gammaproteobacteria bacterium]|nr:serine hydrolase [Gammaproteobacteria bacterium]
MQRALVCGLIAGLTWLVGADTPAIAGTTLDLKALGSPDRVLFWTPAQQQASYPNMDRIFLTREISRGDPKAHPAYPLPDAREDLSKLTFQVAGKGYALADYVAHNRVAGLLVIHNGKIAFEYYGLGHSASSKWTSFSVAKSLTSMLVGAAIKDGYIKDVNDAVTTYLPVLKGTSYDGVT